MSLVSHLENRRIPRILGQSWDGPDGKQYAWLHIEGQRERWFVNGEEVFSDPRTKDNYGWFDVEPPTGMPKVVWPCTERYQPVPSDVAMSPSTAREAVERAITNDYLWEMRDVFRNKQKAAQTRQGELERLEWQRSWYLSAWLDYCWPG